MEVEAELPKEDLRPFPVGDPAARHTQLPARDGQTKGNIERSSPFPNCSYFTNWISLEDEISWDVEVLKKGDFAVTLYYTCAQENVGSVIELSLADRHLKSKIEIGHDPPLRGMEHDRVPRGNSYVKDWKAMDLGNISLEKGDGKMILKALEIPGNSVIDFRLLMFERQ